MTDVRYLDLTKIREEDYECFLARCEPERREKVLRFVHEKDRTRALFSHTLIPYALAESGRDPSLAGHLSAGAHGKPFLPDAEGFHFNLSHAGDYAVIAVSSFEVGVDIERVRDNRRNISERFFGEKEKAFIRAAKDEREAEQRFTNIWTLKESYLKYRGLGLSRELKSFDFEIGETIRLTDAADAPPRPLFFFSSLFHNSYYLAVCGEEEDVRVGEVIARELCLTNIIA